MPCAAWAGMGLLRRPSRLHSTHGPVLVCPAQTKTCSPWPLRDPLDTNRIVNTALVRRLWEWHHKLCAARACTCLSVCCLRCCGHLVDGPAFSIGMHAWLARWGPLLFWTGPPSHMLNAAWLCCCSQLQRLAAHLLMRSRHPVSQYLQRANITVGFVGVAKNCR